MKTLIKTEELQREYALHAKDVEKKMEYLFDRIFEKFEEYRLLDVHSVYDTCETCVIFELGGDYFSVVFELLKINDDGTGDQLITVKGTNTLMVRALYKYLSEKY